MARAVGILSAAWSVLGQARGSIRVDLGHEFGGTGSVDHEKGVRYAPDRLLLMAE